MERIIVPVDFGAASDAALAHARVLATRHGSTVVLLHVLPVTGHGVIYGEVVAVPPVLMSRLENFQEERARKRLYEKIQEHKLDGLRTAVQLLRGSISDAVLEVATADDIIVLGANQRHLTRPGLAEELSRSAPCPFLACHAFEGDAGKPRFERGLVAVDGSEIAEDVALASARIVSSGGHLEFLHVIDPSPVHHVGTDFSGGASSPSEAATLATAETVLAFEEWIAERELGVHSTGFIANDPPAQALLERAVVSEADFIACGAHRSERVAPLGLAEILVRHSPLPVLVVNG